MLLVLDVGNTNTVLGLYRLTTGESDPTKGPEMVANWRITTPPSVQTSDEFGVLLRNLFELKGLEIGDRRWNRHLLCRASSGLDVAPGLRTLLQGETPLR